MKESHDLLEAALARQVQLEQLSARRAALDAIRKIMHKEVGLLVKVAPLPWESLESFAFRSVKANGLRSLSEIANALRWNPGRPLTNDRCRQLMNSVGEGYRSYEPMLPVAKDRHAVLLGGNRFRRDRLALTTSRLCPACVQQYGYGRAYWSLAPLAVCEDHGTYLVDACACGPEKPLRFTRPGYSVCVCGTDLLSFPGRIASEPARQLALEVVRLYKLGAFSRSGEDGHRLTSLPPDMNLADLLDLMAFLGTINPDRATMNRESGRRVVRIAKVAGRFEQAAQALSNWPHGMFQLFRFALSHRAGPLFSARSVYRGLDPISSAAGKCLSPSLHRWFAESVAAFLSSPSSWRCDRSQVLQHPVRRR